MTTSIIILIILISCNKEKADLPILEINPLDEVYSKNKINGYKRWKINGDKLIKWDSITINERGQETGFKAYGLLEFNRVAEYDTNGNLLKVISDNDAPYEIIYDYIIDSDFNLVEKKWKYIVATDTIHTETDYYKFNNDMTRLVRMVEFNINNQDSINILLYSYEKNKLKSILKINKFDTLSTTYIYNSVGVLIQINKVLNEDDFETHYLSRKTGLIDSTIELSGKYLYEYF